MGGSSGGGGAGSEERGRVLTFPSRKTGGLSRRSVEFELAESKLDLQAFQDAHGCLHRRVQEVKDEGRIMKLVDWSGTAAVMGSLDLSIHAIERTVEELEAVLRRIDDGTIPNLDEG